jgi:hypothetical protein
VILHGCNQDPPHGLRIRAQHPAHEFEDILIGPSLKCGTGITEPQFSAAGRFITFRDQCTGVDWKLAASGNLTALQNQSMFLIASLTGEAAPELTARPQERGRSRSFITNCENGDWATSTFWG